MAAEAILEEEKIADTVQRIHDSSFTILEFIQIFEDLYQESWRRLTEYFGEVGEKRRYIVSTCLSSRLGLCYRTSHYLLEPLVHYCASNFVDRWRAAEGERGIFNSPWISVHRKT